MNSLQVMLAVCSNLRPDPVLDILTGTVFNMSLNLAEWENGPDLVGTIESLATQCFSQNPMGKTNSHAHIRIVYLRALLNAFKAVAKLATVSA
jgi:hypothetical protein